jgi:methylase of polypeptide subunit release factors
VDTVNSDLLTNYPFTPDFVIANLPYVDATWERSPDTNHEPKLALFAPDGGKALIYKLIVQSTARMKHNGILILEADPEQHHAIIQHATLHGFKLVLQQDYCIALKRT